MLTLNQIDLDIRAFYAISYCCFHINQPQHKKRPFILVVFIIALPCGLVTEASCLLEWTSYPLSVILLTNNKFEVRSDI